MENRRRSSFRQLKSLDRKRVTLARNARVPSRLVRVSVCAGSRRPETDGGTEEESDRPDYSGK